MAKKPALTPAEIKAQKKDLQSLLKAQKEALKPHNDAVASAAKGLALPADLVAIGEVGLAGEIRKVSGVSRRLAEAHRLGFKRALVPTGSEVKIAGMEIVEVSRLDQAIARVKINAD